MSTLPERLRTNWVAAFTPRQRHAAHSPVALRAVGVVIGLAILLILMVGVLYDARVIAAARGIGGPIHAFFGRITRLGQSDWLLIPSGAIAIIVALGDWRHVSRESAAAWREIGTFAALLFAAVALTGITADIIKPIVGRFRPDFVDGSHFAPLMFGGYGNYSFPSGHATTMATIVVLAAFAPGRWTWPIVVAAVLVGISRVMLAVHFPSDVVGGALLGGAITYVLLRRAADAGIGYAARPHGRIDLRFGAVRMLRRRRSLASLLPTLWIALTPEPRPRIPAPDRQ